MAGGRHRLEGHELEQAPGDGGQGSLVCRGPWGRKKSGTTEHAPKGDSPRSTAAPPCKRSQSSSHVSVKTKYSVVAALAPVSPALSSV